MIKLYIIIYIKEVFVLFIINSIWEYFINFMEQVLFIIFVHTKLHKKANFKNQSFLMLLFLTIQFIVLCFMNQEEISSYITLLLSCILDIIYVLTFYRDNIILRFFWGFAYSIICLIAEQLTFFIPTTLYDSVSTKLLLGGELRKPYTMLYLAMIAVLILMLHYVANKDITLSPFQKITYILIAFSGLAIGHYILRLTLEFIDNYGKSSFSTRLSLVNLFFVVLFLALLVYIYQLGYSKRENLHLIQEQKIHELEREEFNSLVETTKQLREIKHDIQIYLDTINILVNDKKWDELISYTEQYYNTLSITHITVSTGNTAIDCILTSKLDCAKRLGIKTTYSIIVPDSFPLDSVELSSLLGNIWNNAIEAGEKLLSFDIGKQPYIYFYIKPYQHMILIHIENNFDGEIKRNKNHEIISTKSEKNHGLGLPRVKSIIEKSGGVLQITSENNIFSVHIMLPDKENKIE